MPPRILPRAEHNVSRKDIDADALNVMYRLKNHGFLAYMVGGGVRDLLLGRRPKDIDAHVDDILAKKPRSVWFQQGIRNAAAAEKFARAGIDVVQDRCLLVELGSIGR